MSSASASRHRLLADVHPTERPEFGSTSFSLTPRRLRIFLANIEKSGGENGCWEWTGALNKRGYPSGAGETGTRGLPAHRIAYEWMVGPIPADSELDHLCRNRRCVNPHHLEPVTHSENLRRIRRVGPFQLRRYCKKGHALVGSNARMWSNGGGLREVRCYECHRAGESRG